LKQSILTTRIPFVEAIKLHLAESPIAYRLARGAFWSLIGGIASRALTMGSSIIVARLLGKEGYGEIGMVQSTIGMLGVFAGFGLGATATKYIAEFRTKDPARAASIVNLTILISLITGGLMAIMCLGMSGWLAEKTLNRVDLSSLLAAGALLLFVSIPGGVLLAALAGFEAFREIARINIWQGVAAPLITVPLVFLFGTDGAVASMTINAGIGLYLCVIAMRREYPEFGISCRFDRTAWNEWPVLLKFALPSMLSGLMVVPVIWVTNTILANQPGGYGELGLFNAANQWRMLVIFLPGLLTSAMLPVLSETHGREDQTDFVRAVILNLRITWAIALPLTVLVITMNESLAALFGKQFKGTAPIISVLMISVFLNVVNGAVGTALAGSGKMWTGTFMNFGWAFIMVGSSVILVPRLGGLGLAVAYLISYLAHTIWVMAYVELRLARFSISKQWQLMLFSLLLLIASAGLTWVHFKQSAYHIMLVGLSLLPLIRMVRAKFPNVVG
jgi:O-antigen/teichoic acid export membrane protein